MLYRSKMDRVRWPLISVATRSWMPARFMLRTADRRRSWKSSPGTPARWQASGQPFQVIVHQKTMFPVKHPWAASRTGLALALEPAPHIPVNRQRARTLGLRLGH